MKLKKVIALLFTCVALTCAACAASNVSQSELQKQWETLSDQERSQVYEIIDKRAKTEFELLEKYAQLGLIDESKAEEIQKHIMQRVEDMKKEGVFPGAGKGPREEAKRKTV